MVDRTKKYSGGSNKKNSPYLVEADTEHPDKGRERGSYGGVVDDRGGGLDLDWLLFLLLVTETIVCYYKHPGEIKNEQETSY